MQDELEAPDLASVVTDSRRVPLNRLAAEPGQDAGSALRFVIPAEAGGRVLVAAFGSSI